MPEKMQKGLIAGKMKIDSAFDLLFAAIDAQEEEQTLDQALADKLRKRCVGHQKKIMEAFHHCAQELKEGEFDGKEQEAKILETLDSVMPILKDINKIQARLNIKD